MTWGEFLAARQLLAEEQVGSRVRAADAAEDAAFNDTVKALRRVS